MNNILSYSDFLKDLEVAVYTQEVNEGTGIRGFFNKRAGRKVARRLADEIEMSKSIMDGIAEGLEKLNDNFDVIRQDIASDKNSETKGEKQKKLDEISKILEDSREQTWDLHQLIDEGEIDYAGFTANVGFATVTYFGILLFPVRASVIMHKGYNYFFSLIKNTVRKALVMLQLNFDQFQNLIIYNGFASSEYVQDLSSASEVNEFYGKIISELTGQNGIIKNKREADRIKMKLDAFNKKNNVEQALKKQARSNNPYNMLDQYNNTYTKTLEALRQYAQDDVQKELDGIKNSMQKLATGDVDLQAYAELIIASAEEHAYKVSTSIYNKFAKMSEVFSLPNQKKMIQLITAAAKEEEDRSVANRKRLSDEAASRFSEDDAEKFESEGSEIFTTLKDASPKPSLGEYKKDERKYSDIKYAEQWTYEEYKKLDEEKQEKFEQWLQAHKEVMDKVDDTLKIAIPMPVGSTSDGYFKYIDAFIDYIGPAMTVEESKSSILNFEKYVLNEENEKSEDGGDAKYFINLEKSKDQLDDINALFIEKDGQAEVAMDIIGEKFSQNKFAKNAKTIIKKIKDAYEADAKKEEISKSTYDILSSVISVLKDERTHEYPKLMKLKAEDKEEKKEDKKEKESED